MANLHGKPMLWHVWNRVRQSPFIESVILAVDNEEVYETAKSWGAMCKLTADSYHCGTARIASIVDTLDAELIINVQADECCIDVRLLEQMIEAYSVRPSGLITPITRFNSLEDLQDPNKVKVVINHERRALYFSRQVIPYDRDGFIDLNTENLPYFWHIGVYGYERKILERYHELPESYLEQMEKLEQLRFLEAGIPVYTFETEYHTLAVDTLKDLERVEQLVR